VEYGVGTVAQFFALSVKEGRVDNDVVGLPDPGLAAGVDDGDVALAASPGSGRPTTSLSTRPSLTERAKNCATVPTPYSTTASSFMPTQRSMPTMPMTRASFPSRTTATPFATATSGTVPGSNPSPAPSRSNPSPGPPSCTRHQKKLNKVHPLKHKGVCECVCGVMCDSVGVFEVKPARMMNALKTHTFFTQQISYIILVGA
jgi:hypothetical protein